MSDEAKQGWVGKLIFERNGVEPHMLIRKFVENQMNEEINQPHETDLWCFTKKSTSDENCMELITDFTNYDVICKKFTENKTKHGPKLHLATKTS